MLRGYNSDEEIPSVFVNAELLPRNVVAPTPVYKKVDYFEECKDDRIVEFKVFVEIEERRNMDGECEVYCSTPEVDSESDCDDSEDRPLYTSVVSVQSGYIVNNGVFLTKHQYHTLIHIDLTLVQCALCNIYTVAEKNSEHVDDVKHKQNLKSFPPLERFDLSITRKIGNKYHCAVCNELFTTTDSTKHFESKMHEGNLLFAVNKANDVLYDQKENNDNHVNEKVDTYHFRTNSFNDADSYSSDFNEETYNNHHFINYQSHEETEFVFYEDEDTVYTSASYANMARKPKIDVPTFFQVELGGKKFDVKFDSYNMVIRRKGNRFHCMACNKSDHIRHKIEHCQTQKHIQNLDTCHLVENFKDYYIRQVDNKLYHCGHCNNLQLIHEMEDHIESKHPKKSKNIIDNGTPQKNPVKNKNNDNKTKNTFNDENCKNKLNEQHVNENIINTPVINKHDERDEQKTNDSHNGVAIKNNENANNDKCFNEIEKKTGIYSNTAFDLFGYKITIASMAFHVVCKRVNDFYCGLCNSTWVETDIWKHVSEISHIQVLQRTPFIQHFSYNLIRAIREKFHCANCNMPVSACEIFQHIQNPQHMQFVTQSIGFHPNMPPPKLPQNLQKPPQNVQKPPQNLQKPPQNLQRFPHKLQGPRSLLGIPPPNILPIRPNLPVPFPNVPQNVPLVFVPNFQPVPIVPRPNNIKVRPPFAPPIRFARKSTLNPPAAAVVEVNEKVINENTGNDNDKVVNENVKIENNTDAVETEDSCEEFNNTFESMASEDATFNVEEYVYLKLNNFYYKVSNSSYNTLVHVGDGSRYCFVCNEKVEFVELQRHVDGPSHMENMDKCRFLENYGDNLFRQMYLMYHCCTCNVIISRKNLKAHIKWPTHELQIDDLLRNLKKTRKSEIKGGIKEIVVFTQKENIYLQGKEPDLQIVYDSQFLTGNTAKFIPTPNIAKAEIPKTAELVSKSNKLNKIILLNGNVLKVAWDSWHGVSKIKSGYRCNLCQKDLAQYNVDLHCASEMHNYGLSKPFEKEYAPALIRKINSTTLNCLICNTEVPNRRDTVYGHINGKKHIKNFETIHSESCKTNTYSDCDNHILDLDKMPSVTMLCSVL